MFIKSKINEEYQKLNPKYIILVITNQLIITNNEFIIKVEDII